MFIKFELLHEDNKLLETAHQNMMVIYEITISLYKIINPLAVLINQCSSESTEKNYPKISMVRSWSEAELIYGIERKSSI